MVEIAGRGPAPKPPGRRARRNAPSIPTTRLPFVPSEQPPLPDGITWHPMTIAWWETLRRSPLADAMMAVDWSFMLDTALLHTRYWAGDAKLAAEIRLRVAKFGITVEDRRRLRMEFGPADGPPLRLTQSARERYALPPLTELPDSDAPVADLARRRRVDEDAGVAEDDPGGDPDGPGPAP